MSDIPNDPGDARIGRLPTGGRSQRWRRVVTSSAFLGLVLAVLTWPTTVSLYVPAGVDTSWITTLATAAHSGMPFGTHIVFTYGPLGFLRGQQLNYRWTTALSICFYLAFATAVLAALVWSLRRAVPLIVAVTMAYALGALTFPAQAGPPLEDVLALVLIVCVAILSRVDADQTPRWIWVVMGGVLSLFSLIKVSLGVGIVAVLIITVVCLPSRRWRAIGSLLVGAIPTFCLFWFGTGNGFGNIVPFAKSSIAVISGYAPAMSYEDPTRFYTYVFAVLVIVGVGAVAVIHVRGLPRRSTIGISLITLVVLWLLVKEGFVRHDPHDLIFFAAAPLVLVAFAPKRWSLAFVPVVLVTAMFLIAAVSVLPLVPRPDVAVPHFVDEVATVASPGRAAAVIGQSRQSLRVTYALSDRMVALMAHHTVDVSPWEQTVVWAYPQIRFDPLPVIQDYTAYTPSLDQLDASYLASPAAPRFILRQPQLAIDRRDPAFEPPDAQLAIECRYHQVASNASWQLLQRGADRCGPMKPVGTVTTGFRHWVTVPTAPPDDAIVARFQLSQGLLSRLEAIAFKPPSVFIAYNRNDQTSRFVAATASDAHLLRPASTLGYSRGFLPIPLTRFRFLNGGPRTSTGVRVSFYEVHVAPVAGGNGEALPDFSSEVLRPANGASLSGVVSVLDARVTDGIKVTKVEFHLTSPSHQDVSIAKGSLTPYGWFALWNSTKVANGTYMLQSVAYDSSGRSSRSPGIVVTVSNP